MPRNESIMAAAELTKDKIMRARRNFSSESMAGPRLAVALMSLLRAGEEMLVPNTTKELGTLVLRLLILFAVEENEEQAEVFDEELPWQVVKAYKL